MTPQDKQIVKDILSKMGGIRIDRMLEDSMELIERFNDLKQESILQNISAELEDVVEAVEEGKRDKKGKRKVRKTVGKN